VIIYSVACVILLYWRRRQSSNRQCDYRIKA